MDLLQIAILARRIAFPDIARLNAQVLEAHLAAHSGQRVDTLDEVVAADAWARGAATEWLAKHDSGSGSD